MKSQYVEMIVAIANQGSIGGAATQLGKTQPAISSALRKAEMELGAQLFDRLPHGVVPTLAGQLVVDRCRKILAELQGVDEAVLQSKGHYVGTLNLIATPMAAIALLPDILRRYHRKYPDISVVASSGHTPPAFQDLWKGEVDYVMGPPPDAKAQGGLKSVEFASSRVLVVTGKASKYIHETDPLKLSKASWLDHGSPTRRPLFFGFFEDHGIEPPMPKVCADSISCILSLVEGSDDLFCIPESLFQRLRGTREFGILPVSDRIRPARIYLTSANDRFLTPAAIAFADIVLCSAGQHEPAV